MGGVFQQRLCESPENRHRTVRFCDDILPDEKEVPTSYGRSKSDLKIEADQVAVLARLFDLDATPEELEALAAAL